MLNLQAPSFVRTMWARMVQAERHARGCADFAYALKHARAMPAFSWTTVALCLKARPRLPAAAHDGLPTVSLVMQDVCKRPLAPVPLRSNMANLYPATLHVCLVMAEEPQ